jgi:broad specificity phosphatase PhoE
MASQTCKVLLVRHGQVENPKQIFYGRMSGFGLAEIGRDQAFDRGRGLASEGKDLAIGAVFSSPLQRAKETAENILRGIKTVHEEVFERLGGFSVAEDFVEIQSPLEGATCEELETIGWDLYTPEKICQVLHVAEAPPFESFEEVYKRVVDGLKDLAAKAIRNGHKSILITSHGDVCLAGMLWGRGLPPGNASAIPRDLYPAYCSVTALTIDGDGKCLGLEITAGANA